MKLLSHTNAKSSDQIDLTEGHQILTTRILQLVDRKFLAARLGIHESMISHWLAGNKAIPAERMFEIVKAGKAFCVDVSRLESEIDMQLVLRYGARP